MSVERYNIIFGIQTKEAMASLGKFQKRLKSFFSAGIITSFAAIGGTAIAGFAKELARTAGRAETVNRAFERTFGDLSNSVRDDVKSISSDFLRATTDIKKGLVSFQSFFQGLGFGSKKASEFSKQVQKASLDLASFYGLTDEGAQKRFISALAGSPEVLDQFGINLKQAALQVELYNMGINSTVQNTSELIKTQARLNIINRSMTASGILGDVVRNVDSYGNKVKALNSSWTEFKEVVGRFVLPAMSQIMVKSAEILRTLTGLEEKTEEYYEKKANVTGLITKTLLKEYSINKKTFKDTETQIIALTGFIDRYKKSQKASLLVDIEKQRIAKEANKGRRASIPEKVSEELTQQASAFEELKKKAKEFNEIYGTQITVYDIIRALENEKARLAKIVQNRLDGQADALEESHKEQRKNIDAGLERLSIEKQVWSVGQKGIDAVKQEISDLSKQAQVYSSNMLDGFTNLNSEEIKSELDQINLKIKLLNDLLNQLENNIEIDVSDILSMGDFDVEIDKTEFDWFDEIVETIKDGEGNVMDVTKKFETNIQRGLGRIGDSFVNGFSSAFGDAILAWQSGEASFKTAFKHGLDNAMAMMAADLAARAVYYSILGAGYSAGIIANPFMGVAGASSAFAAAGVMAAGAAAMGGISAAIPNKRTGRGGNGLPQGAYTNLQGQSSFGQVLVAEVDYDKLRFVLNNGQSSSFRSNG